ncbi:MAG: hypothetical protein H0W61_13395 [Bacteroidetes bacterium]|nr:hypothetical protein [Bacteroidota bacterium]
MIKRSVSPIPFYIILSLSMVMYILLGYFTKRTEFSQIVTLFGLLFAGYAYHTLAGIDEKLLKHAISFSLSFRLSLLFMVPNLSDDYFRFIWDGRLSAHGINPFIITPSSLIGSSQASSMGMTTELYSQLNSQEYHTIYPPVLQFIFWISAHIFPGHVMGSLIVMRLFIVAAEAGSIFLISALLKNAGLPSKNILLYALNPLVIVELTGNLHFEAVMIFFLLLFVFFFIKKRPTLSAIAFSLAVCSKLLPLMFLPLFLRRIGIKKSFLFYSVCLATTVLLFLPFIDVSFFQNIFSSLNLYFQKFEFNASIFYLIRWGGFQAFGFDVIGTAGIILSLITITCIISVACCKKPEGESSFFYDMLICLTAYFVFATTVHPWYISTLVLFSVFTTYRFSLVWSGLIVLTYFTYRSVPYSENLLIVVIEYCILCGFVIYEWNTRKIKPHILVENIR